MKNMMKNGTAFMTMLALLFSSLLLSCEKETEYTYITIINLEDTEVDVGAEGGLVKLSYSIENPIEGEKMSIQNSSPWLSEFNTAVADRISFQVAANGSDTSRTAKVILSYGSVQASFTVTQRAARIGEDDQLFQVSVSGITMTQFDVEVLPKDDQMTYYVNVLTAEVYDEFQTDEELYDYMFEWLEFVGSLSGMTLDEVLHQQLKKGDYREHWDEQLPETEYVFFAYGLELENGEAEVLTHPYTVRFRTAEVKMEKMEFDLEIKDMASGTFKLVADPDRDDLTYFYDFFDVKDLEASGMSVEEATQQWISNQLQVAYIFGQTWQERLEEIVSIGTSEYTYEGVINNRDCIAYAMGINDEGYICTETTTLEFRTYQKLTEQNQITGELLEVGGNSCRIKWTTTNNDPYVIIYSEDDGRFDGKSEEEIMEHITELYAKDYVLYGDNEIEINWLNPNTPYRVYAYGWDNGLTTDYYVELKFTTTDPDKPADVTFEFTVDNFTDKHFVDVACQTEPSDACYMFGLIDSRTTEEELIQAMKATFAMEQSMGNVADWGEWVRRNALFGSAKSTFEIFPGLSFRPYAVGVDWNTGDFIGDFVYGEIFTAPEGRRSEYEVSVSWDKYFDVDDLYEAGKLPEEWNCEVGSGKYLVATHTSINCSDPSIWFYQFTAVYDDADQYGDFDIMYSMTQFSSVASDNVYCLEYDKDYWLCALAAEGGYDYTQLFRSGMNNARSGASPVEEFSAAAQQQQTCSLRNQWKERAYPLHRAVDPERGSGRRP